MSRPTFATLHNPVPYVFAALISLLSAPTLFAATLVVGPNEAITRIADAARMAEDGDTILIMPGEYRADVAVWTQRRLTIRGASAERPVLIADGANAEGKAIWVIRDGSFLIENIEFRNARVPDGNGAGIRFERGRLEVRNSRFIDNQNGILTANFPDAELIVRDSEFGDAPRPNLALPHLLYVGKIGRFELTGSRLYNGYEGHLIKTRARENEIRYNMIYDHEGGASYELEFPNGGVARIVGNVIGQSETTQNPIVISYGAEGQIWSENRLQLAHNTLVSAGLRAARFLHIWDLDFTDPIEIEAYNNLTVGLGAFTLGINGTFDGNYPLPPGILDPDTLDFTLGPRSLLRGRITPLGIEDPLRPTAEFVLPVGTVPQQVPTEWAPGAFQSYNSER